MDAETETAIQNLSKDTADLVSIMKQIAKSLVNIELHLQAMRPWGVQPLRGPPRCPVPPQRAADHLLHGRHGALAYERHGNRVEPTPWHATQRLSLQVGTHCISTFHMS